MGRRPKKYTTKQRLDVPDSFNLANNLRLMAKSVTEAEHIKETTIQAAGLRELTMGRERIESDGGD